MRYRLDQLAVLKAASGDVHRNVNVDTHLVPALLLARRFADRPLGDEVDQAGVLGQRNELVRLQEPARGMSPAGERLGAAHRAGAKVDLGLVVEGQLADLDAAPKIG